MRDFLIDIVAAQTVAGAPKAANRRHRAIQIGGGIVIALIIGAALFIAAALTA
jgi:hypothetical protein